MRPKDPIQKRVDVQDPNRSRTYGQAPRTAGGPPDNYFLVGLRGSGKSTLGRRLAQDLGLAFVDTDEQVVAAAGMSIAQLVAAQGWEAFRDLESDVLRQVAQGQGQVVATGGGIILRPQNREVLRGRGAVFYLMASIPALLARLTADPLAHQRPALPGSENAALADELRQALADREHLYLEVAHMLLGADKPLEELAAEILEKARLLG